MKKTVGLVDHELEVNPHVKLKTALYKAGYEVEMKQYIHDLETPEGLYALLAHTGAQYWNEVEDFKKTYKDAKKIAIIIYGLKESETHHEIPIFSYNDIDGVLEFLRGES